MRAARGENCRARQLGFERIGLRLMEMLQRHQQERLAVLTGIRALIEQTYRPARHRTIHLGEDEDDERALVERGCCAHIGRFVKIMHQEFFRPFHHLVVHREPGLARVI